MICPYRKQKEVSHSIINTSIREYFADCYEEECPFYVKLEKGKEKEEFCLKADAEVRVKTRI